MSKEQFSQSFSSQERTAAAKKDRARRRDAQSHTEKATQEIQSPHEKNKNKELDRLVEQLTFGIERYLDRQLKERLTQRELSIRLREDMYHYVNEAVTSQEKCTTFFYKINHKKASLERPGYQETTQELNQNTAEYQQQVFDQVPSRTIADGDAWLKLNQWALDSQIGDGLFWSSPPDLQKQGYLGTTSAKEHSAQEKFFSFFWLFQKVDDDSIKVYQWRGWQNINQILQLHQDLAQPILATDPDQRIQETIVRNQMSWPKIPLPQTSKKDHQNFITSLEKLIYSSETTWFIQPIEYLPEFKAQFWQEEEELLENFLLPTFWRILGQLPKEPDQVTEFRNSEEYQESLTALELNFELFYTALMKWLEVHEGNKPPEYSFTDHQRLKQLRQVYKTELKRRTNKEVSYEEEQNAFSIFGQLLNVTNRATSMAHCVALTPFSMAQQVASQSLRPGLLQLLPENHQDLQRFQDFLVPKEPGWKIASPQLCQQCSGERKCTVMGPCSICAACDPRAVKVGNEAVAPTGSSENLNSRSATFWNQPENNHSRDRGTSHSNITISPADLINGNLAVLRNLVQPA